MSRPTWFEELETLATRFAYLGVNADLPALTFAEAWQLLAYLRRIAEQQANG